MQKNKINSSEVGTIKEKLWTKQYILTTAVNVVIAIIFFAQATTLALYTVHIGGTTVIAGLVMSLLTLASFALRQVFGYFVDAKGRKPVLVFGLILMTISPLFLGFVQTIPSLFIFSIIRGIGFGAATIAVQTIVADVVPHSRLSEGIGYFGVIATIATALGPAIVLAIINQISYLAFFIGCAVLSIIGIVTTYLIGYKRPDVQELQPEGENKDNAKNKNEKPKGSFFEISALRPAIIGMFFLLAASSINLFVPSFAESLNITNISSFFSVYAVALLASRIITGKLSDKVRLTYIILPSVLFIAAAFFVLSQASGLGHFLVGAVLFGLGSGSALPLMGAIVIILSPIERRGAANATFLSLTDVGMAIGSFCWGAVSKVSGFGSVYFFAGLVTILSGMLFYALLTRKFKSHNI